jgi:hypothetical protein
LDARIAYHIGFWIEHSKHSIIEGVSVKGEEGVIEMLELISKLLTQARIVKRFRDELRDDIKQIKRKYHGRQWLDTDDHNEIVSFLGVLDTAIENEMDESIKNIKRANKASLADSKANERVYAGNQQYDVYKDIVTILESAQTDVFIVDSYPDETLIDLYLNKTRRNVPIRILFNPGRDLRLIQVGKKIVGQMKDKVRLRYIENVHDRLLFVDTDCYVMGQSIKDAGRKPTYLIKVNDPSRFKPPFEELWQQATDVSS